MMPLIIQTRLKERSLHLHLHIEGLFGIFRGNAQYAVDEIPKESELQRTSAQEKIDSVTSVPAVCDFREN